MTRFALLAAAALAALPQDGQAQAAGAPAGSVMVEHYYRIRWGSAGEFKDLYAKNHAPLLEEMRKAGFITGIRTEEPFTHMAGDQRWDLRVTITYRDADAAVVVGGVFDKASEAVLKRLYPDKAAHEAAEARRFALLEEHWDVIVTPVSD